MRRILLIAAFAASASGANAINQINPMTMSCSSTEANIERDGAVILRYPSKQEAGLDLFDRYVKHESSCTGFGVNTASSVLTKDNPICSVSTCRENFSRSHQH